MYHFSLETSIAISSLVSNTALFLSDSIQHKTGLFPWFHVSSVEQRSENFLWNFAKGLEITK